MKISFSGVQVIAGLLLLMVLHFEAQSSGYSLEPWIIHLEPASNKLNQELTLKYGTEGGFGANSPLSATQAQPIPLELTVVEREIDQFGKVINRREISVEDFVIFPSQLILYPGDEQKVQLQWVGEKQPIREKSYTLIVEQIPIDIPVIEERGGVTGGVTILTRYEAIITLSPKNAKPNISIDSVYRMNAPKKGPDSLVFLFSNIGTGRQSMEKAQFEITPRDDQGNLILKERVLLTYESSKHPALKHSIFPGDSRRLVVPWPADLTQHTVSGKILFP